METVPKLHRVTLVAPLLLEAWKGTLHLDRLNQLRAKIVCQNGKPSRCCLKAESVNPKSDAVVHGKQKPLLDEYVYAWIGAERARGEGETRIWDQHAKRAAGLADQLALTPRGRKAINLKLKGDQDGKQDADPFAGLDELEQKRKAKGA